MISRVAIAPLEFNIAIVVIVLSITLFFWFVPCFKFLITKREAGLRLNFPTTQIMVYIFQFLSLLLSAIIAMDILSWISKGSIRITYRKWDFWNISNYVYWYLCFLIISYAILLLWQRLLEKVRLTKKDSEKLNVKPVVIVFSIVLGTALEVVLIDLTMDNFKVAPGIICLIGMTLFLLSLIINWRRRILRTISGVLISWVFLYTIAMPAIIKWEVFAAASHCDGLISELEKIRKETGMVPKNLEMEGMETKMDEGESLTFYKSNRIRYISCEDDYSFIIFESLDDDLRLWAHCYDAKKKLWRTYDCLECFDEDLDESGLLTELRS